MWWSHPGGALGSEAQDIGISLVFNFNVRIAHRVVSIVDRSSGDSGGGGGGGGSFSILFGHLDANQSCFLLTVGINLF